MIALNLRRTLRRLRHDERGLALIEFAYMLPIVAALATTGAELANYIVVRMRVSQLALHIADNASRVGAGSVLVARRLTETDINDVLTGAGMQAGSLDLYNRGRVIISDLEPMPAPNNPRRYRIGWQRCRGLKNHASSYGTQGQTGLNGIGPAGRQVEALDNNATMFVEVAYDYKPIVAGRFAPSTTIIEIASMAVRERRDLSRVWNTDGATMSACNRFTAT